MAVVHSPDGRYFQVDEKNLRKVSIVCGGDGQFYEIDQKLLTKEVKPESLGADTKNLAGQPFNEWHCGVCSVRG
jgi:hypothetical protein